MKVLIIFLILAILLLIVLFYITKYQTRVLWFDVVQDDRISETITKGAFTERIDYFNVYNDEKETSLAGTYMLIRNDLEILEDKKIAQLGQGAFYFNDGAINFSLPILRDDSGVDPAVIDPGYVFSYPIIGGTGRYLQATGYVTFDVKTTLRKVIINYQI
jgi:hypothetical protein